MESLLNKIEVRLEDMGNRNAQGRLRQIRKTYGDRDWRLGIVGAFSRGKSHLLNLLLDSDLLPEDVLPATTVLTEISYGSNKRVEFLGRDERRIVEASNESLSRYSSGNEFADADGILKIKLPSELLKPNLVFYDTPGIDDLLAARADRAFEALEFCDAALVLVSAISPLGLNERQFISEYLRGREKPRIALVVAFLDQMDDKSANRQLRNIREGAKRICPQMEVWSTMPNLPGDLCEVSGIGQMRKRIREWAQDPANAAIKKERERKDVEKLLELESRLEEAALRQLRAEDDAAEEELSRARRALHEQGRDWTEIRNNFLDASLANLENLQNLVMDEMRSFEDGKGENGASRAELREITEKLAAAAQKNFNEDLAKLLAEIRQNYGISPNLGRGISFGATEINEELCPYLSRNNESIRLFLDLMDRHSGELILWLPLPAIGQRIVRELARRFLIMARKKFDDPGQRLEACRRSISTAAQDLRQMLREAYGDIVKQVQELKEQWLERGQEGLESGSNRLKIKEEIAMREKNIKELKNLRAELAKVAITL